MIGSLIRDARNRQRLTLREISERSGIAVPNLSRLESGRTDARMSTVLRVLGVMGLTLEVVQEQTLGIDDVRQRMEEGAQRLRRIGVTQRGVEKRLSWKEARGIDTSVERRMLDE